MDKSTKRRKEKADPGACRREEKKEDTGGLENDGGGQLSGEMRDERTRERESKRTYVHSHSKAETERKRHRKSPKDIDGKG